MKIPGNLNELSWPVLLGFLVTSISFFYILAAVISMPIAAVITIGDPESTSTFLSMTFYFGSILYTAVPLVIQKGFGIQDNYFIWGGYGLLRPIGILGTLYCMLIWFEVGGLFWLLSWKIYSSLRRMRGKEISGKASPSALLAVKFLVVVALAILGLLIFARTVTEKYKGVEWEQNEWKSRGAKFDARSVAA